MNYTKIILLLSAAKESYDEGILSGSQYLELLNDIENGILKVDVSKADIEFRELIGLYTNAT